ncbi:hypothetical protein CMUS01_03642 [Colletotrichum musicola]|uniref:Uncharacterized protein n=1 Tax=Colletotrichum musicola TaxID=2175873 RepID=A0A8H6U5D8_9PEZI|nr:hypothetical protein CMUS01_03642 [Colletotrichum musicola]
MSSSFESPSVLVRITSEFAMLFAGTVTKLPLVSKFLRHSASGNLQIARSRSWFDMIDARPLGHEQRAFPTRRGCTFCHAWEHEPRQAAGRYRRPYHATSKLLFARLDTMNDTLRMAGDALQAALLHCCGMQVWPIYRSSQSVSPSSNATLLITAVSVGEARQTTRRRLKAQKAVAGMHAGGSIKVTAAGAGDFDLHAANLVAPVTPPDTIMCSRSAYLLTKTG